MECVRGRVTPNPTTRIRLFADSGGFCQNPSCLRALFIDEGDETIHVAEMAHIVAASDEGPRANLALSDAERAEYDNLLLLCSLCHTLVDKAPGSYPDSLILEWKHKHKEKIAQAIGAIEYPDRASAHREIQPLLRQNKAIFDMYGPSNEYHSNPESDLALVWQHKVLSQILPNNRKILAILDANQRHLNDEELDLLESFRQHEDDLEARHIGGYLKHVGTMFPTQIVSILGGGRNDRAG